MIISDDALKNKTKGVPASPSFPVAIPMIEQIMMRPENNVSSCDYCVCIMSMCLYI